VKWNGRINHWHRIPDMVRHAFRVAMAGTPGPVHLVIPEDVLNARGDLAKGILFHEPRAKIKFADLIEGELMNLPGSPVGE
jgi:thiamine pyrophosphate-dependent acetolactate synthase large subunit-like protein